MNVRCGICHQTVGCECEQQPLFPADRRCTACGATRPNLCGHDADISEGAISATRRRPKSCLNAYDPSTAPFPDGF